MLSQDICNNSLQPKKDLLKFAVTTSLQKIEIYIKDSHVFRKLVKRCVEPCGSFVCMSPVIQEQGSKLRTPNLSADRGFKLSSLSELSERQQVEELPNHYNLLN